MIKTTIKNDKIPSYIQSVTINQIEHGDLEGAFINVEVNFINNQRPADCDISGVDCVASFIKRNKFAIGPQFVKSICEHLQIRLDPSFKLPTENELIEELNYLLKSLIILRLINFSIPWIDF